MKRKTIGFFPAHPAQVWMLYPVAIESSAFADTVWILRDKDCTLPIADALGLEYVTISCASRGMAGNAAEFLLNTIRCVTLTRKRKIDLWVSKYGAANIAARITGTQSISFNDDDADVVPLIAWTSYPFAHLILTPRVTRMGVFARKTLTYSACHELFYLHPNRFVPDDSIFIDLGLRRDTPFAIMRFSALSAHHDTGVSGINTALVHRILCAASGIRVFISSEGRLPTSLEPYRISIAPERMHHGLAFAEFFVGDSQTMTAEAAILGTPSLRLNSFVGRISYIQDLEDYGLAFGFRPGEEHQLLEKLGSLRAMKDRKSLFQMRRRKYLADKIDPVPWFTNVLHLLSEGQDYREILRFQH